MMTPDVLPDGYRVPPLGRADRRLLPLLASGLTVRTIGGRLALTAPRQAPAEIRAEVKAHGDDFRRLLACEPVELSRRLLAVTIAELNAAGCGRVAPTPATRAADHALDQADLDHDPAAWISALSTWRLTWLRAGEVRS